MVMCGTTVDDSVLIVDVVVISLKTVSWPNVRDDGGPTVMALVRLLAPHAVVQLAEAVEVRSEIRAKELSCKLFGKTCGKTRKSKHSHRERRKRV
jgi:hypothetical protein